MGIRNHSKYSGEKCQCKINKKKNENDIINATTVIENLNSLNVYLKKKIIYGYNIGNAATD